MLTAYLNAAMGRAHYEPLSEGRGFFGTIEGLEGVWAEAENLDVCRDELREVLEEWVLLGLRMGHNVPAIGDFSLNC